MMHCSYSPEDNKLRLYTTNKLEPELYARVKAAGFKWAGAQRLFVAPMWTPDREDLLVALCGKIGDEDMGLVERAEDRAERFGEYRDNRLKDAEEAKAEVDRIADGIPLGQPLLVYHHSYKHARKDAERIENDMRKAINLWETATYWKQRAAGALRHATYKESPGVRARRIKGLEADKRKHERNKTEAEKWLRLWTKEGLTLDQARRLSNVCHLTIIMEGPQTWSAYDVLQPDGERYTACPVWTVEQVQERAQRVYPATIATADRWIAHYENRLTYERALLEEQGASSLLEKKPRLQQLPLCNYRQESFSVPNKWSKGSLLTYPQIEMTSAEYANMYRDYKGTATVDNSHRIRVCVKQGKHYVVFLTDSKRHDKPPVIEHVLNELPAPRAPLPSVYQAPDRTKFDDMKDALKNGVQVVVAHQLFATPPALAERMAKLAELELRHETLEPSAGTGVLLDAIVNAEDHHLGTVLQSQLGRVVAVEINPALAEYLERRFRTETAPFQCLSIHQADFLSCNGNLGTFDRIIMNPPFEHGADILHILHARTMLKPGGKIVALCANGPRQQEKLMPLAATWEPLPVGTFRKEGTDVRCVLLTMTVPA